MDASEDYDILLQDDEAQDEHDEHEDDMTTPPTVVDTMLLETLGMLHHQWKDTNKAKQECLEHTLELEKIQSEMIALANGTRPNYGRMMITLNEKATKEEEIIELKKEESSCKEDIEANLRSVAAELNEEDKVNISSSLRHLLWTLDDNNFTSHLENQDRVQHMPLQISRLLKKRQIVGRISRYSIIYNSQQFQLLLIS